MIEIKSFIERPLNEDEIKKLHQIMVKGYELTEEEIWGKNYVRLFYPEFKTLVLKNEILIAYYNSEIVGCLRHYAKDENTYSFGLLSVDFDFGRKGIGKALIDKVEEIAKSEGYDKIQIEILRVKDMDVPHKVVLAKYYERLGYNYTKSMDCSIYIPDWKYKLLVRPSDFDVYVKEI
ncbi:MAG: GNAT family N-acetyltransferase [Putridiphycobacter sp.]